VSLPVVLLIVVALAAVLTLLLRRFGSRRQRAMGRLLDAADALEERLRTARSEIEAITGNDDNPVREPL
jgi:membrane protein implicated in regulation of membrane protease activity